MTPSKEVWTVGRLLQWTADYLKQRGADTPRLDAEVLLAHALGCRRIELYTAFGDEPSEAARQAFREYVRQRAEGRPVAYLVGRREFYSLPFQVTPAVLIPRPETEFVVIRLLDLAASYQAGGQELRVADVGTGSGILAVCAAKRLPRARVVAIDSSPAALEVARLNATELGVADRVEFFESDLFAALPVERGFDFVVSNPPYVSSAEYVVLAPEVRDHEPREALEAGPRGTEIYERLIPQAAERLVPGGWLLMEISPMLEADVTALVRTDGRLELGAVVKDLAGLGRVVQAQRR